MSKVIDGRHLPQAFVAVLLCVAVAVTVGCTPPPADDAHSTTTGSVTVPVEVEEPISDPVEADLPPEAPGPEEGLAPEETTPEETVPSEETVPEEVTPEETAPEETTPTEEAAPEEVTPEEPSPEEVTPTEEPAPEEATPEETTPEETPTENTTPEEVAPEEAPPEETPTEQPAPEETTPEEASPEEATPAEEAAPEEETKIDEDNRTFLPTVTWMPTPVENADAVATAEAEMKPYSEVLVPDKDDPTKSLKFDMVPIVGGTFTMGSPDGEADRNDDEGPQREVAVEPFWMGKHEVTWDEYALWAERVYTELRKHERKGTGEAPTELDEMLDGLAKPTPAYTDMTFGMGKSGGYPAICMTQLAARMYCKWLSARTGRFYRLPTEAEWEYACRAGTKTAYSFGDSVDDLEDYGWFYDNAEDGYQKVGQKKPNPWGLYDMHGNVSEWVLDGYKGGYEGITATFVKPEEEFNRVARGGCWDDDPDGLRSAARRASNPSWKEQDPQFPQSIWYLTETYCPGFRVVRPLKVPDVETSKLYEPDYHMIQEHMKAQAGKE